MKQKTNILEKLKEIEYLITAGRYKLAKQKVQELEKELDNEG